MMYLLKLLLCCFCLMVFNVRSLNAAENFEDADQVNEFITMSFSSSHPYDLRQTIPGEPDVDYPIYGAVPRTNFDCEGRHEGYYADTEARCQVFRICANTDVIGKGFAFLCPNGTLFSQKNFVCDWYRNVDCNESERFYSKNDHNQIGTKTDMMKTVRQMMEHPMKTISIALNRGKSSTTKPPTYSKLVTSPTKRSTNSQTTSAPSSKIEIKENSSIGNQPINNYQGQSVSSLTSPIQKKSVAAEEKVITSPLEGGFKSISVANLTITPPSPTFTPPFETPLLAPYDSALTPENVEFDGFSSQFETPLTLNEEIPNEQSVYISSLGELSTDPGSNFNRQTSRVIADPPSNELDTDAKPLNAPSGMNFAAKVNAGLNGLEVNNPNEIIAPEYVKNIMKNNEGLPDGIIQPVPFDFASNINSLLDEVNYEAQSEIQNVVHFDHESSPVTKKPFRFLSRGFSHDKSEESQQSVHGISSSARNKNRPKQHSTSTQSYSNSLITTLITSTQPPVTSTHSTQNLALENTSNNAKFESAIRVDEESFTPSSDILETIQQDKLIESQILNTPNFDVDLSLDSKPAIKREPKELKVLDSVANIKELSADLNVDDKANANKRAEDLLLAGVKQIAVSEPVTPIMTITEEDENVPIIPLYNRVIIHSAPNEHITSSSTTSTIATTTSSSTLDTTLAASTTDAPSTSPSTPLTSIALPTTTDPTPTPIIPTESVTVASGRRRQSLRTNSYARRNNLQRSTTSRTTSTIKPDTTVPTIRSRLRSRLTSTTSSPNPTKTTISSRRRLNVNRYTYASRRRTTESTTSSTSSTTIAPTSRKLNVQNSETALSDLTGAASTYNGVSNRSYNSIRQNSNKYTQTKRRRPTNKNNTPPETTTTTTIKPSLKNSTTPQPRSSSSYPAPTLASFSHHEALSPMSISSTTPETLPATFLSFNDLTKSITDDSILQNLRNNQAFNRQLTDSAAFRRQQQALPRQQVPFSTVPKIQQEHSTQRPPLPVATTLPFIPLKDFIASKFGAHYSPEPPKLSTSRPALIAPSFNNEFFLQSNKKPIFDQQFSKQQFTGVRQELVPQINQHTENTQHQHQKQLELQQYHEQQLKLQQHQQKLQQLKQEQNHLQQQYQLQQQKLQQQQQQQQQIQQQQKLQQLQAQPHEFLSTNPQQIFPAQRYNHHQHHQQQIPVQKHSISMHQVSTKIVPSIEQQFQIQSNQQSVPLPLPQQQIQIIPAQMTASQTILPQQTNFNLNSNIKSEIGSINVRLPSNLVGLIPNTNIFNENRNDNVFQTTAQRRSDQSFQDAYGARERKSVFAGVSSYDVPLSSVGRLTNDISHFLRQRRL